MKTITFTEFDIGLDHRKSAPVADANRLRELKNAYVTPGKVIRKRPGLTKTATLETGTHGLVSGNGVLNTFYQYGSPVTHADTRFVAQVLEYTTGNPYPALVKTVHYGTVFIGYLYVVVEFVDGVTAHYYLDGDNPNVVADSNCPNGFTASKQESRMWAGAYGEVRYSALRDPHDWSTVVPGGAADDAGFIGVGEIAEGSVDVTALGQYNGKLVVFFIDGLQMWDIGPNVLTDIVYDRGLQGIGCPYPYTPIIFAGDLIFLSKSGFRSVTTQTYTANLTDVDVGSPIDDLVRDEISAGTDAMSAYFIRQNQLWCMYTLPDDPTKTRVWVYSYSRSVKVAAWSKYEIDFPVSDMVVHNGDVYLRSGDDVYAVDETDEVFTDGEDPYEMRVEFPFIHCKLPGIDKCFVSMDAVITGTVQIQFKYDPNDETKMTQPITLTGDSRPLQSIPLEITATALAPVFTSTSGEVVQIDAFSFNYEELGG